MVTALGTTIADGDIQAVHDILDYCRDKKILLHITPSIMTFCNKRGDFEIMQLLMKYYIYYRVKKQPPPKKIDFSGALAGLN